MSLWSRIANVFRADRLNREIEEELQSHIEEAIEQGRDPEEARRAFGSALRRSEETRDVRLVACLDSLRADAVFGWRRLKKTKVTSAAAILSLALAIGSCTRCLSINRRAAAPPSAGRARGTVVLHDSPRHRIRWQAELLRWLVGSCLPPDEGCGERASRADRCLLFFAD